MPLPPPVCAAPRALSQLWGCGSLPVPGPEMRNECAALLTLPFHCVPNSRRENGTAWSLLRAPGSAPGTRALRPETWPPLGKGLLRVWPLVLRCPRCSGWDRALGEGGSHSARLVMVIAVRGGKLFLDLLHGWWALPGWRRHGKQEGPLSRVFLKALPYF